jgi:hypothetical protein
LHEALIDRDQLVRKQTIEPIDDLAISLHRFGPRSRLFSVAGAQTFRIADG